MRFIKTDELKPGMRLARPIYSKKGVLIYERAQPIKDTQAIQNIKGFGLIGLFVLEPAEPVPPMTEDDIEFERFQTVMTFEIKDELEQMLKSRKAQRTNYIVSQIVKNYGNESKRINFFQSLRSKEDYIFKHSLNTAILAAIMTHKMNVPLAIQNTAVTAAVVHDIGKLSVPQELMYKSSHTLFEQDTIHGMEREGYKILNDAFISNPSIERTCKWSERNLRAMDDEIDPVLEKMQLPAKVLQVAGMFDKYTAVRMDEQPMSEIAVFRLMLGNPYYDQDVVKGLLQSLALLPPGASVELTNGDKALVIRQNDDVLRPTVLTFGSNTIINLDDRKSYPDLEVADIMKTMDNRHVMDYDTLKKMGLSTGEG